MKKINRETEYKNISRKTFLTRTALGVGGVVLGSIWLPSLSCKEESIKPTEGSKPNVLIMVADDQGWKDVGYHGSEIKTPTLDKFAEENVQLNEFYVCPTCSPTRAALLTGRFPSRFGILGPIAGKSVQSLPMDVTNIAKLLKGHGYTTALMGKWH